MATKATLINEKGIKQVVDVGSQNASSLMSSGYQLMGASGKYIPTTPTPTVASTTPVTNTPATPAATPAPTPTIPEGATRIADPNELKKLTEEQIYRDTTSNAIYKRPEAVVPNTITQTDFSSAMSPEEAGKLEEKAKQNVQFDEKQIADLNKAYQRQVAGTASDTDNKNIAYAKGKGWKPTETQTEETAKPKTTEEMIYELYSNIGKMRAEAKAEAMKEQGLDEKSQKISEAQSYVNKLRTELQNQGIMDIKEQDVIRAKPILNSQIAGQLNELSREQKLDTMILQNNYNNALVEQQIAQGNYDRAREIVKEISDDYFDNLQLQLDSLKFKNQIEDKEYDRMRADLEYERQLGLEGYTHIKSPEGLKGLTEDKIFRDPVSGKIYIKPEPKVAQIIDINGRKVGLDENGNKIRDYGSSLTPEQQLEIQGAGYTIDANGNLVPNNGGLLNIDISQLPTDVISGTPSWAQVLIAEKAKETGVPASLISAVINQESGFNPNASNVSDKERSYGLGQINLNAHPEITKEQATDPGFAINFVANRLKNMINKYGLYEGVQAYNTPGAIGSEQLIRYANNILSMAGIDTTTSVTNSTINQSAQNWADLINKGEAKITDVPADERTEVANAIALTPKPQDQELDLIAKEKAQIASTLKSHNGLNNAVGTIALGRKAPFQWGQKADFIASVEQLVSDLSLESLIDAKSRGATFGALSDTEMRMLASAATKIGTWRQRDKDGNVTGYKASESAFKDELDNISKIFLRAVKGNELNQSTNTTQTSTPIMTGQTPGGMGYQVIE